MLVGAHILRGDGDAATAGRVAVTGAGILATGSLYWLDAAVALVVSGVYRLPLGPLAPTHLALVPGSCLWYPTAG